MFSGTGLSGALNSVTLDKQRLQTDTSCFAGSCNVASENTIADDPSSFSDLSLDRTPTLPPLLGIKMGGYFDQGLSWLGTEFEYFYYAPHVQRQTAQQCSGSGCSSVSISDSRLSFHTLALNLVVRPLHIMDQPPRYIEPYAGIGVAGIMASVANSPPEFAQSTDLSPGLNLLGGIRVRVPTSDENVDWTIFMEYKRTSAGFRFHTPSQVISQNTTCFIFCDTVTVHDESTTHFHYNPSLLAMGVGIMYK